MSCDIIFLWKNKPFIHFPGGEKTIRTAAFEWDACPCSKAKENPKANKLISFSTKRKIEK